MDDALWSFLLFSCHFYAQTMRYKDWYSPKMTSSRANERRLVPLHLFMTQNAGMGETLKNQVGV